MKLKKHIEVVMRRIKNLQILEHPPSTNFSKPLSLKLQKSLNSTIHPVEASLKRKIKKNLKKKQ